MKAGVGTSPCAVCRTPARASPSVATRSKLMRSTFFDLVPLRAPRMHLGWLRSKRVEARGGPSQNQHRVAERVEAIPLLDRDLVEPPRLLHPRERHHEREERRARQVEVRHERVHPSELEPGSDEEVG